MFRKLLSFLDQNTYRREVDQYAATLEQINALELRYHNLDDAALRGCTGQFRERLRKGAHLEDLLPDAFAAVREAARRTIGLRHYDVQMIGGIVLQRGAIAEMRTGEGKTLVATLPLYLNALEGKGAHLVTVNDYLARRDARWMGPIFFMLGMSVGVLQADEPDSSIRMGYLFDPEHLVSEERFNLLRSTSRAEAYAADVTYGTNSEFGFDYLRDNLVRRLADKAQRDHHFAIVDEVDNILIDEARTPLIISGENRSEIEWYSHMAAVVRKLNQREVEINRREQIVSLTPAGEKHVSTLLGRPLADPRRPEEASPEQRHLIGHLEQALRARFLYHRDREYIVQDGQVVIVDEFTGRMMPGRRWTDGLHQAVEAKEDVEVRSESITYATITLQNYFRMYTKLSGMTGTALTAAKEFEKIYKLQVHTIPTHIEYQALRKDTGLLKRQGHEPDGQAYTYYVNKDDPRASPLFWKRIDYPDVLYLNAEAKRRAIAREILRYHSLGRPLLVGTTSVADSEDLARYLEAPMLNRLAQALLLREAWLGAHPKISPDLPVEELGFLNAPLGLIGPARLAGAFAALKLDPDPLAHLTSLLELLALPAECQPRLETSLQDGIPNTVLNARYHYEESQIIAGAGAYSSVIIATNMAGRGVDIKLGGELAEEVMAAVNNVLEQAKTAPPYALTLSERRQALQKLPQAALQGYPAEVDFFVKYVDDMERVRRLGGLHVIGSTRHEARRIDNQLRGRAARQGDPGSSRFFVSMEDELMVRFGSLEAQAFLEQEELRGGDPLLPCPAEAGRRVIEVAQNRVESENFEIRKHLLDYDDVINAQRRAIYAQRDRILEKPDLSDDLAELLEVELNAQAERMIQPEGGQPWQFIAWVERLLPGLLRPDGSLYPSWPIQVVYRWGLPGLSEQHDMDQARTALLSLAGRALQAKYAFIQQEIDRQCQEVLAGMQTDVAGRMDAVDVVLENLSTGRIAHRSHQVLEALSDAAGLPVQLSEAGWQALKNNRRAAAIEVLDQIEADSFKNAAERLSVVLERLLGQCPDPDPADLPLASPEEMIDRARDAAQNAFDIRQERLLAPQGELARILEAALPELDGPLAEGRALMLLELIRAGDELTTEGKPPTTSDGEQATGDGRQGAGDEQQIPEDEQVTRASSPETVAPRLSYIFLVDDLLANTPPDEIARWALEHLMGAQKALQADLGVEALSEAYRQLLLASIDERWVDYLTHLEELRYEVRLEGMAHNDPLVMYKSRASGAYETLMTELRRAVVAQMFHFLPHDRLVGVAEASSLEKATPRLTFLKLG